MTRIPTNAAGPKEVRGQPRRAFERDEPCYVYLAVHSGGQRFKIGLSSDPLRRFAALPEAEDIDLETTVARRMPTRARASQVERSLHRALDPYSLELAHPGDGYTEWFRLDAFATAVAIIDAMPDPTAPAQAIGTPARGYRKSAALAAAEYNVARAMDTAVLWREARRMVGLSIVEGRGRVSLIVKDFRATASNAGSGLRARLLGLKDDYALRPARTPRGVHATPSLVRFISFDGPQASDLRIDLQDWATLRRLPGGERLVQRLRDGIELVRIETRFAADRRKPLSAEQVEAGVGRLLEHRGDEPGDLPSLWR